MNKLRLTTVLLLTALLSGCLSGEDAYIGSWARQGDSVTIYKETKNDITTFYLKDRQSTLPLRVDRHKLYYKDTELTISNGQLILFERGYTKL